MARITGKQAALYLVAGFGAVLKVGDIYDWSFESTTEILPASIKGDAFERHVPAQGSARLTARRYVNTTALLSKEVIDSALNADIMSFRVDLIDATNTLTQILGVGYVSRGSLSAPRGAVVDDFELTVDGEWNMTQPGAS